MKTRGYKRLDAGTLTEELEHAIDVFMNHINYEGGTSEDCYRSEIDFWLKDAAARKKISGEQYDEIKHYYVLGGIYDDMGNPWEIDKKITNGAKNESNN